MSTLTIDKLRERKKLDPIETSRLLGVSYVYLYMIEHAIRNPSDKLKSKMCRLYNVDYNTLFLSLELTKAKYSTKSRK